MPAEWEPHERTWMAWPSAGYTLGEADAADEARGAWAAVANAVVAYEPVTMVVDPDDVDTARGWLSDAVEILPAPLDDAWMRDIGPTFVRRADGALRAVDWTFNAWGGLKGGLYHPWDADDAVAGKIAEIERVPAYRAPFVLEGGAIHVDGEGSCLTTEECLLNPNRNPTLSRAQIEQQLRDYLGVETVLWLGAGTLHDETDGHVDNLCCFLRPGVVALAWTDDEQDPQYPISLDAYRRLQAMRDARGRALEIIKLPIPRTPICMSLAEAAGVLTVPGTLPRPAGERLAASYVNFLICNGAIVLPAFGDPNDELARGILAEQFPGRVVRQVPGREILYGGGNVHCITQQQPA